MTSLKSIAYSCAIIGAAFTSNIAQADDLKPGKNAVSYPNDGDKIAAHVYLPKTYKPGDKLPAVVVNPPASGVKEQTAGIYAQRLADKGFIALAFDPRGFGESEGAEGLLNPFRIADDFSASISYLGSLDAVDKNNIFGVGICAGAGYASYATAFDARIKAIATVSPFLTTSEDFLKQMGGAANLRKALLPAGANAKQVHFQTGENLTMHAVPVTEEEIKRARPIPLGMRQYYLDGKPGYTPNWKNKLSVRSMEPVLAFSIYNYTHMLEPVPHYMVTGDKAESLEGAQRFFDALKSPKEQLMLKGANHFDIYYKDEFVTPAVDGIAKFLRSNIAVVQNK